MYKYSNSAMGGKGSSFIHYPNGEIQELTGSPLYHTATIIKVLIYISTLENHRKAGVGKSSNQR